jgi:AraC family transcriptional regulator
MNRTDVTSLFKKVTNTTLHQFHLEERLQKGFNLLMETVIPVKDISAMVAFRTCPNFTAAFTKRFGMSPREVRRGVRLK